MPFLDRAARMQRHHKRHKRRASLNLVSLMDIFTILVFFLLVNSSDVEVLPNTRDVALPESIAESRARETVVVLVTDEAVLVQGQPVVGVEEVAAREDIVVPELKAALQEQTRRTLRREALDDAANREVTIMGDKAIPYSLLKKIMATCTDADYGRVSLAVLQKTSDAVAGTVAARGR